MIDRIDRREFLTSVGALIGGTTASLVLGGCSDPDPSRYDEADIALLAQQQRRERELSGKGPFGIQRFKGYRGLAELPWFELDSAGNLRCVDESIPMAIDMHCHFGMSVLFEPKLDLQARTERVRHLLDCDATDPGCDLDLDIYINGNFTESALRELRYESVSQGFWGSDSARTQTIPNLLDEMDATRVEKAIILPIAFNFPFGDNLAENWHNAIRETKTSDRLIPGASVHPRDDRRIERLEAFAKAGARVVKLHPTMQAFYPDEPDAMEIYEAADRLGMIIFLPWRTRRGSSPNRDIAMRCRDTTKARSRVSRICPLSLAMPVRETETRCSNSGCATTTPGSGSTARASRRVGEMIRGTGGGRMLFGTDWPFYHLAASPRQGPDRRPTSRIAAKYGMPFCVAMRNDYSANARTDRNRPAMAGRPGSNLRALATMENRNGSTHPWTL